MGEQKQDYAQIMRFNALCGGEGINYPSEKRESLNHVTHGNPRKALDHFIAAIEEGRKQLKIPRAAKGKPVVSLKAIVQHGYTGMPLDTDQWQPSDWRVAGQYLRAPFAEIRTVYRVEPPPLAPREDPTVAVRHLAFYIRQYSEANRLGSLCSRLQSAGNGKITESPSNNIPSHITAGVLGFEQELQAHPRTDADDALVLTNILLRHLNISLSDVAAVMPQISAPYWSGILGETPQDLNKAPPRDIKLLLPADTLSQVLAQRIVAALLIKEEKVRRQASDDAQLDGWRAIARLSKAAPPGPAKRG